MTGPILVTGATGTQGGAVARALLAGGDQVRALTRDPDKEAAKLLGDLGAEIVVGDFDDLDGLRRAAAGTSAVFVMGTPYEAGTEAETRHGITMIDAATQAGTNHIVYSSVASALDNTGVPHFESKAAVERHLAAADVSSTVLAPVAFLDNLLAPWDTAGLAEGRYGFAMPGNIPLQQVAVADLAAFAVLVLQQPERFAGQRIELASVVQTGEELSRALGRWLRREIKYVETPVNASDEDFAAMMQFLRTRGYQVNVPALHAAYPEVKWHDLDAWAAKQDWQQLIPA